MNRLHYIQPEHLGTPRAVIDPVRNVAIWTWNLASEAFGNSPPHQDPDNDGTEFVLDLRFPGQRYDAASGLNYNYFRDYDPGVGRYGQSDPIGLGGGISTYNYVYSASLQIVDPYGLWGWGDPLPQGIVDFSAGMGDTLSFGITRATRDGLGISGGVSACSDDYSYGQCGGMGLSLAFGGAHLGRGAINQMGLNGNVVIGFRRVITDNRTWRSVQRTWSRNVGGYKGRYELHHWFSPRSAGNAIWNYMPVSPSLNRAMSNGGLIYNGFRASVLGIYGATPTYMPSGDYSD